MIFNNYYNVDILLNENSLQLDPQSIIFAIHDSIHTFYSNATINIKDSTGNFRDFLLFEEGNVFTIKYGTEQYKEDILSCNYVTAHDDAPEIITNGIVSGNTNLSLVHEFYLYQNVENKAYKNRISNIIKEIANEYKFKTIDINDTGCDSYWYQLRSNQKDFIETVLLPNCYSNNSNESPFFCFIGIDNILNLKNYSSMFMKNAIEELQFSSINGKETSLYSILDIKPFRVGSFVSKKLQNRKIVIRNKDTGDFSFEESMLKNTPNNFTNYSLPIIGDLSKQTDYNYYLFSQKTVGEKEALKGRILNDEKDGLFLEKFVITLAFLPTLKSGLTVQLNLATMSVDGKVENSLYQSGKYLIEDCIHTWNGEERKGLTYLIVSRKFVKPLDCLLAKKLVV